MDTSFKRHNDSLRCWRRRAAIASILALLCVAFGCAPGTGGLKWSVAVNGSPLGVAISVEPVAGFTTGSPVGWTTTQPGLCVASQPAATLPAVGLSIDPAGGSTTRP